MITRVHTIIRKGLRLTAALVILVCTAASCSPKKIATVETHCAFADPKFMTLYRVCTVAAEYYLAKHEWPDNKTKLDEQWHKMLDEDKETSPENKDSPDFFDQFFTQMDLDVKYGNLVIHCSFKLDDKTIKQRIVLRPGATTDQIMETASD
jgi:hypothetical protein